MERRGLAEVSQTSDSTRLLARPKPILIGMIEEQAHVLKPSACKHHWSPSRRCWTAGFLSSDLTRTAVLQGAGLLPCERC